VTAKGVPIGSDTESLTKYVGATFRTQAPLLLEETNQSRATKAGFACFFLLYWVILRRDPNCDPDYDPSCDPNCNSNFTVSSSLKPQQLKYALLSQRKIPIGSFSEICHHSLRTFQHSRDYLCDFSLQTWLLHYSLV